MTSQVKLGRLTMTNKIIKKSVNKNESLQPTDVDNCVHAQLFLFLMISLEMSLVENV